MQKTIYVDNAATTPVSKEVLNEMLPYFTEYYGNASTLYSLGRQTKLAVDRAREQVAKAINAEPSEIYFTAGGTESDNWAIRGMAMRLGPKGKKHIITSKIEHKGILRSLKVLEKEGFEVTYLDVDEYGFVNPSDVEKAIRPDTALVSIMFANSEIGTIEPISEIGQICKKHGVVFHTDAVQAVGTIPVDVKKDNIDLLSISGQKFHAPKGIGVLYIKKGVNPVSLINGGSQENGKRAGTENVPGIVGIGKAIEIAVSTMDERSKHLSELRKILIDKVLILPKSRLNGDPEKRLPGNASFCFEGIEGEGLVMRLDANGICAATGSACSSDSLEPSHVLLAIGVPVEIAHGSLRVSFGDDNTKEDAEYVGDVIIKTVNTLRAMSPVWDKIKDN
ncbi:MAG: cysteine desulfurase NifS [Oscillospiraceae bacterium]|nr:cysteine desulfurase NifS [Oscillospiraceae bacterium]